MIYNIVKHVCQSLSRRVRTLAQSSRKLATSRRLVQTLPAVAEILRSFNKFYSIDVRLSLPLIETCDISDMYINETFCPAMPTPASVTANKTRAMLLVTDIIAQAICKRTVLPFSYFENTSRSFCELHIGNFFKNRFYWQLLIASISILRTVNFEYEAYSRNSHCEY